MTTILVTGGLGFIGSNFIRMLLKTRPHHKIVNMDCVTYAGNLDNHKDLKREYPERYTFFYGNISNPSNVDHVFSAYPITHVVNFAAESHVDRSISNALPFIKTNIYGTQLLLDAARRFGAKRFCQISTDEVYGSLGATGFFRETTSIKPRNPYAATKSAADFLVLAVHLTFGYSSVVSRCSNNYGPWQHPEKLIPKMITRALLGEPLTLYGDGLDIRDWIHVDDHCRAVLAVLEKGQKGHVYNIGASTERTNRDIVFKICEIMGVPKHRIEHVAERPGHDKRYAMDASKIKKKLGWEPQIIFDQGLRETIDWYSNNKWWWKGLV